MSVRYAADLEELDDNIAAMQRFADHIDAQLTRLGDVVDDLHVTWRGDAAVAHRRAVSEWTHGASEMRAGLQAMLDAARRAHLSYGDAADANKTMWGQVG